MDAVFLSVSQLLRVLVKGLTRVGDSRGKFWFYNCNVGRIKGAWVLTCGALTTEGSELHGTWLMERKLGMMKLCEVVDLVLVAGQRLWVDWLLV